MSPYIINRPENARWYQHLTSVILTLFFWAAILYLWSPLLVGFAHYIDVEIFEKQQVLLARTDVLWLLMQKYSVVILMLATVFLLWARVNQWLFQGKEKRIRSSDVSQEEVARHFNVNADQLLQWQQYKNSTIELLDDGTILFVQDNRVHLPKPENSMSAFNNKEELAS